MGSSVDVLGSAKPTRFDCTFTVGEGAKAGQSPHAPESVYEYGFEYMDTEFRREWLYRIARKERQSTQVLFERTTEDGKVRVSFGSRLRGENRTIANSGFVAYSGAGSAVAWVAACSRLAGYQPPSELGAGVRLTLHQGGFQPSWRSARLFHS